MRLKDYFLGVAAKRLKPVEADANTSNQHEFNGISSFHSVVGDDRRTFDTVFMYLADEEAPVVTPVLSSTWYDARENHETRSEYRLYYPASEVSDLFLPNDLLVLALRPDGTLLVIAAAENSSISEQILWLFGLKSPNGQSTVKREDEIDREVDYVVRWVLDALGIESPSPTVDTDLLVDSFGMSMPSTRVFSEFARQHADECNPADDADHALMVWLETEERFFRAFERLLVEERLRAGFVDDAEMVDVDGFVSFSLSVQNRRKARAGLSLENHLEQIFMDCGLQYERGVVTERRSKPDFLFPDKKSYMCAAFPCNKLSMLGAKSSCKDRWRQVTKEADRIEAKHLITLEPSISPNQTDEMKSLGVQLVLPRDLHRTYSEQQQKWVWTLGLFLEHVQNQQQS